MRAFMVLAGFLMWLAGPLSAQDRAWVQIEAQPTLREAEERARAYAGAFPDVAGFRMASGWYAIVLGPYTPEAATARLAELARDNLVPADSFVALGEVYRAPFWPVGADPMAASPQGTALAAAEPAPEPAPVTDAAPEATAEPTPPPPPAADESPAEARASEAALNRDDRRALQSALAFFGYYGSTIDGAFGPGTRAAMTAWQEAKGYEPTGVMTTGQRAELFADKARIEAELGLGRVEEQEAGIEIDLPLALVGFDRYEPPFVHFTERNGSGVQVVLISQPGGSAALASLYDLLQTLDAVPTGGPRELRERSFRIEGAGVRSAAYAEAVLDGDAVKGFLMIWAPEKGALAGRALTAMKASFKPMEGRALDPGLVALDDSARAGMLSGLEVRRAALSRSGFYVTGAGDVLTVPEAVADCARITLDNVTEARVAFTDDALGIALLTPDRALSPPAVAAFLAGAARPGSDVAVAGFPFEDQIPAPTLSFGRLAAETGLDGEPGLRRIDLSARPGEAGGPVLDMAGNVLGLLLPRATGGSRVLPQGVEFAVTAEALAARLTAAGLTLPAPAAAGPALAPDLLADRASRMTVLVGCWK